MTVWTMTKDARTLRCDLRDHPLGRELLLWKGDEVRCSQVVRTHDEMLDMIHACRAAAAAKGWVEEDEPTKES